MVSQSKNVLLVLLLGLGIAPYSAAQDFWGKGTELVPNQAADSVSVNLNTKNRSQYPSGLMVSSNDARSTMNFMQVDGGVCLNFPFNGEISILVKANNNVKGFFKNSGDENVYDGEVKVCPSGSVFLSESFFGTISPETEVLVIRQAWNADAVNDAF